MRLSRASTARVSLLLLCTFLSILSNTSADEVRADRSETRSAGDTTHRSYSGDVRATFASARVRADSAVATSDSKHYLFHENVRYEDDRYVVFADRLSYDAAGQTAVLSGGVRLSEGGRSLSADRVIWSADRQTVEAVGGVRVGLPDGGGDLYAGRWYQDVAADSADGSGDVRFVRAASDTLSIVAERVASSGEGGPLRFSTAVTLRQGDWRATSGRAIVSGSRDRVRLLDGVHLERDRSPADSVRATAHSAVLTLADDKLTEIFLADSVEIRTTRLEADTTIVSTVASDSSRLVLGAGEMERLDAEGAVSISVDADGTSSSRLRGSRASIRLVGGHPATVRLEREGEMDHALADASLTATITGYGLGVELDGPHLRGVTVDSLAVCDLEGKHPTRLSGDRLRLTFKDGQMAVAEVDGGVKGQYRGVEAPR